VPLLLTVATRVGVEDWGLTVPVHSSEAASTGAVGPADARVLAERMGNHCHQLWVCVAYVYSSATRRYKG
jgi:hypothetical protein